MGGKIELSMLIISFADPQQAKNITMQQLMHVTAASLIKVRHYLYILKKPKKYLSENQFRVDWNFTN